MDALGDVDVSIYQHVNMDSFHVDLNKGGGQFYYDSTEDTANHNGITILDHRVLQTVDYSVWDATEQVKHFTAVAGNTGCWIRVTDAPYSGVKATWAGCKADGAADDLIPLQSIVDMLGSTVGGTILLPSGAFDISDTLEITNRISLVGQGIRATQINNTNAAGNPAIKYFNTGDVTRESYIRDLRITGNASSGEGVYLDNPGRFSMSRVYVDGHGATGVYAARNTDFNFMLSFYDCWFTNNNEWGMDVENVNSLALYSCSFQTNYGELRFDGQYVFASGTYFGGSNHRSGVSGAVEVASRTGNPGYAAGKFIACAFENNGGDVSPAVTGLDAHLYLGSINTVKNFALDGCYFINPSAKGDSTAISCIKVKLHREIRIEGCTFFKAGTYDGTVTAIEFESGANEDQGVTITRNDYASIDTEISDGTTGGVKIIREEANSTQFIGAGQRSEWIDDSGAKAGGVAKLGRDTGSNVSTASAYSGWEELASITIPGGMLSTDGAVKIIAAGIKTYSAANIDIRVLFNTGGVVGEITNSTTSDDWRIDVNVVNTAASAQKFINTVLDGATLTQDYGTIAQPTASDFTVSVEAQITGGSTETVTCEYLSVEEV
jgi:hypothetical protein